ncbi:hypothetical protein ACSNN5_03020 [Brevibacillus formosus]|uniref:hypothetical protein n=1 Tax=Brevibacillus formosus TaxID=54913 RepID=UPI003F1E0A3C
MHAVNLNAVLFMQLDKNIAFLALLRSKNELLAGHLQLFADDFGHAKKALSSSMFRLELAFNSLDIY